jgi:hypothetical protein
MSIGLEHVDDLAADILAALDHALAVREAPLASVSGAH